MTFFHTFEIKQRELATMPGTSHKHDDHGTPPFLVRNHAQA